MKRISLMLGCVLFFFGCEKGGNCFRNAGDSTTITLWDSSQTNKITLRKDVHLNWYPEGNGKLELTGGKNLLELVKTKQDSTHLQLWEQNTCNWLGKYDEKVSANIYSDKIQEITLRGGGDITMKDMLYAPFFIVLMYTSWGKVDLKLNTDEFYIYQHSGVSNCHVEGSTKLAGITAWDRGILDLKNLTCKNAGIESRGTGNIYITVTDTLSVFSTGTADIHVWGNPYVKNAEINGKGKLILY